MFGRELRTPADLVFGSPPEPEIAGGPELDYFRWLKEHLSTVHQLAREALEDTGARQKRTYMGLPLGQGAKCGDSDDDDDDASASRRLGSNSLLCIRLVCCHGSRDEPGGTVATPARARLYLLPWSPAHIRLRFVLPQLCLNEDLHGFVLLHVPQCLCYLSDSSFSPESRR
ncbi:hypothetical protein G5714_002477 [Onychostoma macrolepis]|uniref:Uncharacterized protein n=1 Tax=Onychostoma macrolepis TaxID=369639 RepID=A0A7J6DGK5_9TELE|nr:hypothetical protein G5714_002477 [Onychostoma macrolepis]